MRCSRDFGDQTEAAVKAFQLQYGLTVDGEVGELTRNKIIGRKGDVIPPDPNLRSHLKLATFAASEAEKKLVWTGANCEAEKYLAPLRPAMQSRGHIGSAIVYYNWCAAFVTYCCRQVGIKIPDEPDGFWATMALVESWQYWAKQKGYWFSINETDPQRGDIITFDWSGGSGADHIGIVRSYSPGSSMIQTSEGNKGDDCISGNFTRYLSNVSGIVRIP